VIDGNTFGAPVVLQGGNASISVTGLTAGSHAITAAYGGDAYFAGGSGSMTETVNPASLTITADDQARVYGQANPTLTASYGGFVNGDTPASLTTPVTLSTPATSASDVGSYPITASGAADPNYVISYVSGTLTISRANQTIVWSNPASIIMGTPLSATQLNAQNSVVGPAAAGALTYSPAAGMVLGVGTQTLTVSAAATLDYNAATASVSLQVLYKFSGFMTPHLVPLKPGTKFALGSVVSLQFQLRDASGNLLSNLANVVSLQAALVHADGSLGPRFHPASLSRKGIYYENDHYQFNWLKSGLVAGTYEILLDLADGTEQTTTVELVHR
jgi:hypothetical protein